MHMKVSSKVLDTQGAVHRVSVSQGDKCRVGVLLRSCTRVVRWKLGAGRLPEN